MPEKSDSPSTELASFKLEALRKYLTGSGFADTDPIQTASSLWMAKGDVNGQAEFIVKSVNGHLNVSGAGDLDGLREKLAQLWLARNSEQVLAWLHSHERQEGSLDPEEMISICRDGKEIGTWPFRLLPAIEKLGEVRRDDFYWRAGMEEWRPLSDMMPPEATPSPNSEPLKNPPPIVSSSMLKHPSQRNPTDAAVVADAWQS